jgi:hypothetical protein
VTINAITAIKTRYFITTQYRRETERETERKKHRHKEMKREIQRDRKKIKINSYR